MMIIYTNKAISVEVYQHLRITSGLSAKSNEAATVGLAKSLFSVLVELDGQPVGMGRLIGDGGCFCQIVDICVLPEQQGKGIGKAIMQAIKLYIDQQLPLTCYVSLLADGNADKLYKQFGFSETMPQSKGMFLKK